MSHQIEKMRDDFAFHLERERNLSVHTIRAYLGDLDSLIEHLKTLKIADLSQLTLPHIRSWLANQQVIGGARTTLSRRAVSIRIFTKWAHKKGHLASDVGISLATPKGHRTLPDVLTVADASLAMDALEVRVGEEEGPLAVRDLAILEVLYATGARVSELCGLDFSDVDYSRNTMRVLGKGHKERTIPLGNPAMKALDAWIKVGEVLDHPMDQFFAKRVMVARLLAVFEEHPQVVGQIFWRVQAPGVKKLQRHDPAVPALREEDFAHREAFRFRAAISSAAWANLAPRLIFPRHRARACAREFTTITPLITGTRVSRATRCSACETLCPCEPGTRSTVRCFSFTPDNRNAATTRASNPSTNVGLKRAATMPRWIPAPLIRRDSGEAKLMGGSIG